MPFSGKDKEKFWNILILILIFFSLVWWGVKFSPGGMKKYSISIYRLGQPFAIRWPCKAGSWRIMLMINYSKLLQTFFTLKGHGTFFGFVNTGIHVIMYSYYMLAAIGPQMQKYLWWKKYLTRMQMIQFIAVMLHALQLFVNNSCDYPIIFTWILCFHAVMFFILFNGLYSNGLT